MGISKTQLSAFADYRSPKSPKETKETTSLENESDDCDGRDGWLETMPMDQWIEEELSKPEEPFLLQDLIMPGGLTIIAGQQKIGKSFFVMGALLAMASGQDNGFLRPIGVSSSLYLDLEGTARKTAERAEGLLMGLNIPRSVVRNIHMLKKKKADMLLPWAASDIIRKVKKLGVRTVVLDTFAASFDGDEDSKQEVQRYLNILSEVRVATGCAAVLIHHMNKQATGYREYAAIMNPDQGMRGSSALGGAYDIIASLQKGWVEDREVKAIIMRGKYSPDFWLEYKINGPKQSEQKPGLILPFKLEFGRVNDEYAIFSPGPTTKQPDGGRPSNYRKGVKLPEDY